MTENFMRVATFWLCLVVVFVSMVTFVVNLRTHQERAALFAWMEQLQQRVIAIEAKQMQQPMLPPTEEQKPQANKTKE